MDNRSESRLSVLNKWVQFIFRVFSRLTYAFKYHQDTLQQIYIMGVQALPLVLTATACVSMVLALEWGKKLELFGAKLMMGRLVGISVIREIGPTITGLMLAGRSGAKMVSEIGNMVLTEQIDALRAFGTDPIKRLIVPRVAASIILMLPLVIIADVVGIIAGWFACVSWLGVDSEFFWLSLQSGLLIKDLAIGFVKPPCYGILIGVISAYYGYTISGGAVGMGNAATKTVMFTSLGVLVMDFTITKFILSFY